LSRYFSQDAKEYEKCTENLLAQLNGIKDENSQISKQCQDLEAALANAEELRDKYKEKYIKMKFERNNFKTQMEQVITSLIYTISSADRTKIERGLFSTGS